MLILYYQESQLLYINIYAFCILQAQNIQTRLDDKRLTLQTYEKDFLEVGKKLYGDQFKTRPVSKQERQAGGTPGDSSTPSICHEIVCGDGFIDLPELCDHSSNTTICESC